MISIKNMKILEDNSEYFGVSKSQLMENAGRAVANYIEKKVKYKRALIISGHGNNGGDGFVTARHLYCNVLFISQMEKLKQETFSNYVKLSRSRIIQDINLIDWKEYDLIIDAILGYGIKGAVKEPYKSLIQKINKLKKDVISIDIPSGLDPDEGKNKVFIKPKLVLTFHEEKPALKKHKLKTVKLDIGIPEKALTDVGPGEVKAVIKERKIESKKGDHGKVLIIGGCTDYTGAPLLAAKAIASLRTGTDWVTIAAPKKVAWAINKITPDIITKKFKCNFFSEEHVKEILDLSKKFNCILIGPGLGNESGEFVNIVIKKLIKMKKTIVIDADAINEINLKEVTNCIITPHKTEFTKLLRNSKIKKENLKRNLNNNIILLKGSKDQIISKNKTKINSTGNPGMTVAGTGDVLSGLCAGIVVQNNDLFNSACAAAFINGKAGDELEKEMGNGFIASDLTNKIPYVIKNVVKNE